MKPLVFFYYMMDGYGCNLNTTNLRGIFICFVYLYAIAKYSPYIDHWVFFFLLYLLFASAIFLDSSLNLN